MGEPAYVVREAVGVFSDEEALQGAIDDLMLSGFDRAELSLLASEEAVVERLGHRYRKVSELEDDTHVPSAAYVSTEERGDAEGAVIGGLIFVGAGILMGPVALAGGSLAAVTAAALAGGTIGGGLGAYLASLIGESHAHYIAEQLAHGGLVLWVRVWDAGREAVAIDILKRHSGRDVHVHEITIPGREEGKPS
jgi:VIT1/CCC1 family predicted Fe2+/Mn2+ transporter